MVMEKRAVIEPGRTKDTEGRLAAAGEKQAGSQKGAVAVLDDDFTKRASEAAAKKESPGGGTPVK